MSINSILSEAFSVYTDVTSIIASQSSAASASSASAASASTTATSSSSSSTTSSSSSTTPTSSSSTFRTSSTPSSTRTSSSLADAAATSAASSASTHHGISGTTLAIILGCVLGALALGLLLLVLLVCCRRRRRRDRSPRLLSPESSEIDSWRNNSQNRQGSRGGLFGRRGNGYERSATPNMAEHPAFKNEYGHQNPFVPVPPPTRRSANNSRVGLTDGVVPGQEPYLKNAKGGPLNSNGIHNQDHHEGEALAAGVGGAVLGAAALHHHDKKNHENNDFRHSGDQKQDFMRKPVANNERFPTTTMNDDTFALNRDPSRKSNEHPRFNADDYGHPYENSQRGFRQPNTSAPLSPFNSSGHARGLSGDNNHHNAMLAAGAGAVGGAALVHHHNNRTKSQSPGRRSYDAAKTRGPNTLLDTIQHPMPETQPKDLVSPVSSDSYSSALNNQVHQHPTISNSNSTSSNGYPPHDRSSISHEMPADVPAPSSSHRNSIGNRPLSVGAPPGAALAYPNHRRDQTPPAVPSRSPKRTRFNDEPDSQFMPQRDSSNTASDDSTWRLSSGLPGGWGRNSDSHHRRDSLDPARNGEHLKNSGINPQGRAESPIRLNTNPRRQSLSPGGRAVQGQGRRLRLADLRRQEEERGRQSMGSEWAGNGGYDGYENHGYGRENPGVGQAM